MIRDNVSDVSNVRAEGKTKGSEPDSGTSAREEQEAPRSELPEWLAKELFKIFA